MLGFPHMKVPVYTRTSLGDSVDRASFKILKESFEIAADKNVIASPLGTLTLLSMYSTGTEGQSRAEIMKLLNFTDYTKLEAAYSGLTGKFTTIDPRFLVFANKMYVSNKFTLTDQFSNVASNVYKSDVELVDFAQKKITADKINQWASEKTKGHINAPVDESTIEEKAAVALFNVIFFQGQWHVKFDAKDTKEKDFYINKKNKVKKPMMKLLDTLYYFEDKNLGARMVELPYQEEGFRMVIVLPDKVEGLQKVLGKLAQRGLLEDVFKLKPTRIQIDFEMPKFEIKNVLNLKNILPKVGVSQIFTKGENGIVRESPVVVSSAFQQAFVKVDEEGSTAGAFTGAVVIPVSSHYVPPPPMQFKVDHPFMFAILHEDIILFTGTYTH